MSYFYNDTTENIFLPSKILPYCNSNYAIDLTGKHLNLLREKAASYDAAIYDKNSRFYDVLTLIKYYYMENDKDDNYDTYLLLYKEFESMEKEDKYFFTSSSTNNKYLDGTIIEIKYIDLVNEVMDDFNSNYYEYYLMAQHSEQYNCCFLYTFRKLSKFLARTVNCPFFYCHFDRGVDNYLSDLNDLTNELQTSTQTNDDGSTSEIIENSDQIENNLNILKDYIQKRENFKSDLHSFYDKLFDFLSPFIRFLVHLKFLIKVVSIASIIINAHSDDAELFQEHANTLINLVKQGNLDLLPATQHQFFTNLVYIFQEDTVPMLIDMKVNLEQDGSITLNEKNKIKHLMLLMAISAAGLIDKCQNLYSSLTTYLSQLTDDKVSYFNGLSDEDKDKFQAKAYIDGKKLNACYIIDYDNPPTADDITTLHDTYG